MAAAAILNFLFLFILVKWFSLYPVAAVYITAKFHSSTSIGGRVIDVCAKMQDGGCRHLKL